MNAGDIISYNQIEAHEGFRVQRGMNYHTKHGTTVVLMSQRNGAPYDDEVSEDGTELVYEGHNVPSDEARLPKAVDQQLKSASGALTENGKFYQAAKDYQNGKRKPELVRVYEKIKKGIWVFNGIFKLVDAWQEKSEGRKVFKFQMVITDLSVEQVTTLKNVAKDLDHNRIIPPDVKLEVWKRDRGRCVTCGSTDNLHFDHILPYSKGGTSLKAINIQLLCARHNLEKRDNIE